MVLHSVLIFITLAGLVLSGINPYDRLTWAMEVAPVFIGLAVCLFTYRKFPLTNFLYVLIVVHGFILMIGGHYTYARVPGFDMIGNYLGTNRNSYDGLGHFAQGFIPALIARELLIRIVKLTSPFWLFLIIVLSCLGMSALYEIFEWGAAVIIGEGADEFLGAQGDEWDTQKDMALAGVGAIIALLLFSKMHDRFLKKME